jgi:hypothetical protein
LRVADVAGVVATDRVWEVFPAGARRRREAGLFTTTGATVAKGVLRFGRRSRCWRRCNRPGVWEGFSRRGAGAQGGETFYNNGSERSDGGALVWASLTLLAWVWKSGVGDGFPSK